MITWPRSYCWALVERGSRFTVLERNATSLTRRPHEEPTLTGYLAHRSCLLHRFVKNEWRVLSSQTIGVEFASKIIRVGTGSRRKRIKLQVMAIPTMPPPRRNSNGPIALGYRRYRTFPIRLSLVLSRRCWRYSRLRPYLACLLPRPSTIFKRCPSTRVSEPKRHARWEQAGSCD